MEGWIKLHRKMLNWQWIKEPKTVVLFLYLLLKASNEKSTQDGIELKAGQIKTNWSVLERELNLTTKEVRTIIERLTKSGEIIVTGYERKFIIITISNFHIYQSKKEKRAQKKTPINNDVSRSYNDEEETKGRSTLPTEGATKGADENLTTDSLLNSFFIENNFKGADKGAIKGADTENHTLYIKEVKEKIEEKATKSLSFEENLKNGKIIVRENVALTPTQIERVVARMGSEKNAELVYDILMAWKIKKNITLEKDREEDFGRILSWCYIEADKRLMDQKIMAKNSLKINSTENQLPIYKKFNPNERS